MFHRTPLLSSIVGNNLVQTKGWPVKAISIAAHSVKDTVHFSFTLSVAELACTVNTPEFWALRVSPMNERDKEWQSTYTCHLFALLLCIFHSPIGLHLQNISSKIKLRKISRWWQQNPKLNIGPLKPRTLWDYRGCSYRKSVPTS